MQMIIEEIQLRQANYRYTVSTLAFNLVLFFDRLDNENIKFRIIPGKLQIIHVKL